MKKLFTIISILLCSVICFGQLPKLPIVQQIANTDSTILITNVVQPRHGLVNGVYVDTVAANLQKISMYPGSQIYTTSDGLLRIRNALATAWDLVGGGGREIHVFLIGGQSNAQGYGNSALSPDPISGTVYQFTNGAITIGNDPIGNANTGSAWPSFGITYYTITNNLVCFVPSAFPGSSQTAAASIGLGTWDTTGTLWDTSVARLQAAMTALTAQGYSPTFKGVLWGQGEQDAVAINSAIITQADYQAALLKMIGRYRATLGQRMPFYIFRTGVPNGASDVGYALVRASQLAAMNGDSLTNIVFYNAMYFLARGLMPDPYHYTQAGYDEMGRIGAQTVINSGFNTWQPQTGNTYFTNGKVGIGIGIPTYPLDVNDSAKIGSLLISKRGFGSSASISSPSFITIQNTSDLLINQSSGAKPMEFRFSDAAVASTVLYSGVINAFNFNNLPTSRKHLLITTSGFSMSTNQIAGNIILRPGTAYANGYSTTQYGSDSVFIELNTRGIFSVNKKAYLQDTLAVPNIALKPVDTTGLKIAVVDASGNFFKSNWAFSSSGGTVFNVATGYGLSGGPITTTGTILADTTVGVGLIGWPRLAKVKDSIASIYTPMARTLTAGYGLTGGGDLSANRSFVFDSATVFGQIRTSILKNIADQQVIYSNAGLLAGSGQMKFTGQAFQLASTNTTQATTSSAFTKAFNSLTTGEGDYTASSSLSSGNLAHIDVSGTAAASNTQTGLNITTVGANANASQTTYGARISNTHTGTTPINVGLDIVTGGAAIGSNWNLRLRGSSVTTAGMEFEYDDATPQGRIRIIDRSGSSYKGLQIAGSTFDLFMNAAVRALYVTATGTAIRNGTTATAYLHLGAGTATASTAPEKYTSGTNLTTPEAGAHEYDGTEYYFTNSTAVRGTVDVMRAQTSSAGTLTLAYTYTDYVFTGTTSTWTLPAVVASYHHPFYLKNAGSGTVTINSAAAGNDIYNTSAVNTYALTAGSAVMLRLIGSIFYVE